MEASWSQVQFSSVCSESAFGPRFSGELYHPAGNVATLRTTDIREDGQISYSTMPLACIDLSKYRQHLLQKDDLVVSRSGRVGTAAVFSGHRSPVLPGAFLLRFRLRPDIADVRFFAYFFNSSVGRQLTGSIATGSVQQNLKISTMHKLEVPLPPLEIQKAIAHILGTLDDKIELNRKMNETLEATARAIFKSWFVDFDPVRAKMEGRQPVGMDAETAKLFPDSFVDSELGKIPKGWLCEGIGSWCTALSGGTPSKTDSSLWGSPIPWISPKVMTFIHADEADEFVTSRALGNGTRLAPVGSSLVMVRGMGLHKEVRVSQARSEVAFNQDVKALVPKRIEPSLLLQALLDAQQDLLGRVEASGHGTGRLPSDVLLSHPITMPPVDVQRVLTRVFDSANVRIEASRRETRILVRIRDALLPKLLSGEIRVKDAERMEAAT